MKTGKTLSALYFHHEFHVRSKLTGILWWSICEDHQTDKRPFPRFVQNVCWLGTFRVRKKRHGWF